MLNILLALVCSSAFAQMGPPAEVEMPPKVVQESTGREAVVLDPEPDRWDPRVACSGGVTDPAAEAALMEALLVDWPHVHATTVRDDWRVGAAGSRVCMRRASDNAVLCFEPRGDDFIEVMVGPQTCFSREEALRALAAALDVTIKPRRRIVLPAQ